MDPVTAALIDGEATIDDLHAHMADRITAALRSREGVIEPGDRAAVLRDIDKAVNEIYGANRKTVLSSPIGRTILYEARIARLGPLRQALADAASRLGADGLRRLIAGGG